MASRNDTNKDGTSKAARKQWRGVKKAERAMGASISQRAAASTMTPAANRAINRTVQQAVAARANAMGTKRAQRAATDKRRTKSLRGINALSAKGAGKKYKSNSGK